MSNAAPMTVDELEKREEEEFRTGPLSVLTTSVKTNSQACYSRIKIAYCRTRGGWMQSPA